MEFKRFKRKGLIFNNNSNGIGLEVKLGKKLKVFRIERSSKKEDNTFDFSVFDGQKIIESLQRGFIEPPISAKSALQTSRLVHALYKSDELQDWVKLKDKPISNRLGKELRS